MIRKLFIFILIFTAIDGWAQPCQFINITTTPLLTLPECEQSDGTALFTNTTGGTSPYRYTFNNQSNQIGSFGNLSIGVYELVIADFRGCRDTFLINLTYRNIEKIIKPDNAFTPNGDNINDIWFIAGIESLQGTEVRVFNRWGQMVHQNTEYSNEMAWDGTQGGNKLPASTYYYVISIKNNCVVEQLNGTVTILR